MDKNDRGDPAPVPPPQRLLGGPISQSGSLNQPLVHTLLGIHFCTRYSLKWLLSAKDAYFGPDDHDLGPSRGRN